jgi:hypothetical protein
MWINGGKTMVMQEAQLNAPETSTTEPHFPGDSLRSLPVRRAVLGLPPAKQVELSFEVPRTTASKWVRRARERGFLDGKH